MARCARPHRAPVRPIDRLPGAAGLVSGIDGVGDQTDIGRPRPQRTASSRLAGLRRGGPVWFGPSPGEAAAAYRAEGDHREFQLAIDLAEHALRSVPDRDPSWPTRADELAGLLAAQFDAPATRRRSTEHCR